MKLKDLLKYYKIKENITRNNIKINSNIELFDDFYLPISNYILNSLQNKEIKKFQNESENKGENEARNKERNSSQNEIESKERNKPLIVGISAPQVIY